VEHTVESMRTVETMLDGWASLATDLEALRGVVAVLADDQPHAEQEAHIKRYTLLHARALFRRDERGACLRTVLGWMINWIVQLALLQIFLMYACEVQANNMGGAINDLLYTWLWSIGQKVVFNEPLIILSARGLPMILRSRICSRLCSEASVEYMGQGVEAGGLVVREGMGA